jgi:hypothetical protein
MFLLARTTTFVGGAYFALKIIASVIRGKKHLAVFTPLFSRVQEVPPLKETIRTA